MVNQSATDNRIIISGASLLRQNRWENGYAVVLENKKITAIIYEEMISHHLPARQYHFDAHHYLIPGLIDLHIHGIAGHDVMDNEVASMQAISNALAQQGVTGFLATTMTASREQLSAVLTTLAHAKTQVSGAEILGVHLEGPFIAAAKQGAQQGAFAELPDVTLINTWQQLSQDAIKIVTLAPELLGALPFIQHLVQMGIIPAVGHTNATYDETLAAIDAGCRYATHLFNAMRAWHHREPGATGALLLSDQVIAELIVDSHHLHDAAITLACLVKGVEHLLLVTDAMRATCMPDGSYILGDQQVTVRQGLATLADGTLAGSTLSLTQAINHMVKSGHCSLIEAIHMASTQPAAVLGLSAHKGAIDVGFDADLVVLDANLTVKLTLCRGYISFEDKG